MAASGPPAPGACCCHGAAAPGVHQTLEEMDFERGIWSAALDGDLVRVRKLVGKQVDPSQPDRAGYTALAAEKGHLELCELLLQHSPSLKGLRDRKARRACDLVPSSGALRDLLETARP